jgi:hypothetical protein
LRCPEALGFDTSRIPQHGPGWPSVEQETRWRCKDALEFIK